MRKFSFTLKYVCRIRNIPVLLGVAVLTHSDWLSILDGCTAVIITGHDSFVDLILFPRTDSLKLTVRFYLTCKYRSLDFTGIDYSN